MWGRVARMSESDIRGRRRPRIAVAHAGYRLHRIPVDSWLLLIRLGACENFKKWRGLLTRRKPHLVPPFGSKPTCCGERIGKWRGVSDSAAFRSGLVPELKSARQRRHNVKQIQSLRAFAIGGEAPHLLSMTHLMHDRARSRRPPILHRHPEVLAGREPRRATARLSPAEAVHSFEACAALGASG
jgi:hypothetical protein